MIKNIFLNFFYEMELMVRKKDNFSNQEQYQ